MENFTLAPPPPPPPLPPPSGAGFAAGFTLPEDFANDPVAKAVYDNIMGNIPKRQKVHCLDCKLEFSSDVVLKTHLAGAKHKRKVKTQQMLQELEGPESGFEKDLVSGSIRCLICDVTVNSPQLLATHVAGNKHQTRKGKRASGEQAVGVPSKKLCPGATDQTNGDNEGETATTDDPTGASEATVAAKKERQPLNIVIPSCVTKVEDNKSGGKYICNPCQAHCNSDIQLSQHLSSKKHLEKVNSIRKGPPSFGTAFVRGGRGNSRAGLGWKPRGGNIPPKWPTTQNPGYSLNYIDSGVTQSFSDGFGVNSVNRPSEYGLKSPRAAPAYTTRGSRGRGLHTPYPPPPRPEAAAMGREVAFARPGSYGRVNEAAEYANYEYHPAYGRSHQDEYDAADDFAVGYGSGHSTGRGMAYAYAQQLPQSFVHGSSLL